MSCCGGRCYHCPTLRRQLPGTRAMPRLNARDQVTSRMRPAHHSPGGGAVMCRYQSCSPSGWSGRRGCGHSEARRRHGWRGCLHQHCWAPMPQMATGPDAGRCSTATKHESGRHQDPARWHSGRGAASGHRCRRGASAPSAQKRRGDHASSWRPNETRRAGRASHCHGRCCIEGYASGGRCRTDTLHSR